MTLGVNARGVVVRYRPCTRETLPIGSSFFDTFIASGGGAAADMGPSPALSPR